MRERRIGLGLLIVAIVLLAMHHPSASIRITTQDRDDPAPHSMQAAVDLGLVGVSLFWSWSGHHLLTER